MRRRDLLRGAAALAVSPKIAEAQLLRQSSASSNHQGAAPSDLSVTFSGGPFRAPTTFAGANAVYVGPDYIGEYVRQKWFACKVANYPLWTVWFRVDADHDGNRIVEPTAGWRNEVVVEYGIIDASVKPTDITSPYSCTIRKNGAKVYSASDIAGSKTNYHYWFSRWRWAQDVHGSGAGHWRSKVVRTPRSLITRGWLPKFTTDGMFGGGAALTTVVPWPGPMGMPNNSSYDFEPVMGNAGDNPSIGYVTEQGASYVLFGNSDNFSNSMCQAEWVGTWQIFTRDVNTLAPPNYQGDPRLGLPGSTNPGGYANNRNGGVQLNLAHWYPNSALAFMLTDDPFHLEGLQFGAAYAQGYGQYGRSYHRLGGLIDYIETRAFAWGLRDIARCAAMTPASVPSVMYSQTYWKKSLADNKTFVEKYTNNTKSPTYTVYSQFTQANLCDSWMNAWAVACMGFVCQLGFDAEWLPPFTWAAKFPILLTSNYDPTMGWPRQWFCPYEACFMVPPAFTNAVNKDDIIYWWDADRQVTTSAATASGNTITMSSPNEIAVNQFVTDLTTPSAIPANTQVTAIKGTTVTLSNNVANVGNGDSINFSNAYQTAADAWAAYASGKNGAAASISPSIWSTWGESTGITAINGVNNPPGWKSSYTSFGLHVRSALAIAAALGIPGASACYGWVQGAMPAWLSQARKHGQARFSISP